MNGRDPQEGGRGQPEYGAEAKWDTWGMYQTICACLRQCCAIDAAAAARSLPLNDTPKIQALWCTMAIARVQASHLHIRAAALHAHQLNNVAAALATLLLVGQLLAGALPGEVLWTFPSCCSSTTLRQLLRLLTGQVLARAMQGEAC